ncbi:hypothetical protein QBC39DRAFT_152270 [Podospora conica]|nr:hypothetical protein QBC39DRAFT_152270 [Schizothecium conicum]
MTRGWRLRGCRPAKSRQKRSGFATDGGCSGVQWLVRASSFVTETRAWVQRVVDARSCRSADSTRGKWPLFVRGDREGAKNVMASFSVCLLEAQHRGGSGQRSRWMDVGEEDQVSIGGPLAAEFRFGSLWGGGLGEHGDLSPEGESFKRPSRTPVGQTPLAWQQTAPDWRQLCLPTSKLRVGVCLCFVYEHFHLHLHRHLHLEPDTPSCVPPHHLLLAVHDN